MHGAGQGGPIQLGPPQGVPGNGKRPRIDFFHQRINGSSDFAAPQYPAMNMNFNAMRPPSRHKDPPQNIGLDLPPNEEDDLPSLDEDSDSSDEFEIGIENAGGLNAKKRNLIHHQQ